MHQLKQFGAGLLLGGIDVLIAVDHVDVDGELVGAVGERLIASGDFRIALRTEIPDGGRVFDQKREIVFGDERQRAGGVGADGVLHAGVETVVDMSQGEVEVRANGAQGADLRHPILLHEAGEFRRGSRETRAGRRRLFLRRTIRWDRSLAPFESSCGRRRSWA